MIGSPLLHVDRLVKRYYTRGFPRRPTFTLTADFRVDTPATIGVLGPNGSGKTTLFELMTGSNAPTSGRVLVEGRDIHGVRYDQRDRLAIHYHQSYQVRAFRKTQPSWTMAAAGRTRPFWDHANRPSAEVLSGGDFGGHPRLWPGSCRGSAENVQGNLFGDGLFVEA